MSSVVNSGSLGKDAIASLVSGTDYPSAVKESKTSSDADSVGKDHTLSILPFCSRTILLAVLFPTPLTVVNALISSACTAAASVQASNVDSIDMASLGPTPEMLFINVSKAVRSASVENPYRVMLSCLNCKEVNNWTDSPMLPISSIVFIGAISLNVIPETLMSTYSAVLVSKIPVIDEIKVETILLPKD